MKVEERAHLRHILQGRREAIVAHWYNALAPAGATEYSAADFRRQLGALTDQAITVLLGEPFGRQGARDIGAALARLDAHPATLGRTLEALAAQLVAGLTAKQVVALHPRLMALLGEAAAGFGDRAGGALFVERRRAKEALTESERWLRVVVNHVPIILFAIARQGIFTLAEGQGLAVLRLQSGEAGGRAVFDLCRDFPQVLKNVRRALAGETFTATVEVGETVFETWYSPTHEPGGNASGVIGVAADITARVRAETASRASEARFRALLHEVPLGIAFADQQRQLLGCNAVYERLVGYREAELRGRRFPVVTHPDDAARDMAFFRELLAGRRDRYDLEKRYRRKDGRVVWGHLTAFPVPDAAGQPQLVMGVVEDLTARKRAQEALQRLAAQCQVLSSALAELPGHAVVTTTTAGTTPIVPSATTRQTHGQAGAGAVSLSPRERQVLALIASGHRDKEIADKLFIAPKTVESHVGKAMNKLAAHTRTHAVVKAIRQRLLTSQMLDDEST